MMPNQNPISQDNFCSFTIQICYRSNDEWIQNVVRPDLITIIARQITKISNQGYREELFKMRVADGVIYRGDTDSNQLN